MDAEQSKNQNGIGEPEHGGVVIDRTPIDEYVEMMGPGGRESMSDLIDIYLQSSPVLLQGLQEAMENHDLEGLRRSAHSWKSSSASLGAARLSELCKTLEFHMRGLLAAQENGRASEALTISQEVGEQIGQIAAEFERVRHALQNLQHELGAE